MLQKEGVRERGKPFSAEGIVEEGSLKDVTARRRQSLES